MKLTQAMERLTCRENLSATETAAVLREIMEGKATAAQIGGFLAALRAKGETVDEITGAARAMREHAIRIRPRAAVLLDTCGTGGDHGGTFNISTATAIVAAACGVAVAKHGNRAMSGRVGGADVLEALGVNIELAPERVCACIEEVGIGFLFAQAFHPAMKHAAGPRRELGIRTLFNLLGPLSNPAGATHQLLGVYAREWVGPLAVVLGRLGSRRALVVHGDDGLDEISLSGPTYVAELNAGEVRTYEITPEQFGFECCERAALRVANAEESAAHIRDVLAAKPGPHLDIVLLNAGAALYAAEAASSIGKGIEEARRAVDDGGAEEKLRALVSFTRR